MDFKDFILPIVGTFLGYLFGYRKQNKEIDSIQIENIAKSVAVYQDIIEDLRNRITELQGRIQEMDDNICELRRENHKLKELLERYESR